jgi:hypothetical protein
LLVSLSWRWWRRWLESVGGGADGAGAAVEDVGVDLGGLEVAVAEEFLDSADVVARLEEMGGEAVAKGVARSGLGEARPDDGFVDGSLEERLIDVVATLGLGPFVEPPAFLGEDPLPGPVGRGVGVLESQGVGQGDPAPTIGEVLLVNGADANQVVTEQRDERSREHGDPVLGTLAGADNDLEPFEVDVLDPKLNALLEPQTGAIEEFGHEKPVSGEVGKDIAQFVPGEDDGQTPGLLGPDNGSEVTNGPPEHRPVKEQEGGQGLVLGGTRHVVVDGQGGEEGIEFPFA